jgi:beta-lactamase class A
MIFYSDNTATNLLLDRLGMDRVNRVGRALGLSGTQFRRKMMDFDAARRGRENVTTLADQALLYEELFAVSRGLPLPDAMSSSGLNAFSERSSIPWGGREGARKALEILLRVRSDSMLLRYFTEEECLLAHKPGGLSYVRHDAGIFFPGARDVASACGNVPGSGSAPEDAYFFGVFTTGMPEPEAKELIGRLSRYVYETRKEWLHA